MTKIFIVLLSLPLFAGAVFGMERISADEFFGSVFPRDQREAYENSSGSCVYMSTAAAGIYQNQPNAWLLPWDSDYGEACRGGSYPSLFEAHAKKRGLDATSITGEQTIEWIRWGIKNNRWVAIGAGTSHFQTCVGWDEETDDYYVWNCNDYHVVTKYSRREFDRLRHASGLWCIVMDVYPDRPPLPVAIVK